MPRIRKPDVPIFSKRALCASQDPARKDAFTDNYSGSESRGPRVTLLKELCKKCEALVECREFALSSPSEVGVWGGMTERERREFRKRAIGRRASS